MKRLRFTIAGLMILVLIAALDFGVIRALLAVPSQTGDLIVCGTLPMANILVFGLIHLRKSQSEPGPQRSGLIGFLVWGVSAWLIFFASSVVFGPAIHDLVTRLLQATQMRPGPIMGLTAAALLVTPQLVPALIGGWLGRRYHPFRWGLRGVWTRSGSMESSGTGRVRFEAGFWLSGTNAEATRRDGPAHPPNVREATLANHVGNAVDRPDSPCKLRESGVRTCRFGLKLVFERKQFPRPEPTPGGGLAGVGGE